jgi:hypothetical protein
VIVGEHDPFKPYRSESRLFVYKQADAQGLTWSRFPIDNRFEHHDGAKTIELGPSKLAIMSHGWIGAYLRPHLGTNLTTCPLSPVTGQRSRRDGDGGDGDSDGDDDSTAARKRKP